MAYFNSRDYTSRRGLNLTAANGAIRFETPTITPTTTSGERLLYVNSSNQLIFDSGSSTSTLGAAGSVANFSLNDAYDDGAAITVDSSAVRLNGSHATNNLFELRYTGSGTGNIIDIQNDSTGSDGSDIIGTDDTWAVSSAGALTCISIADSATDATLQVNGNGTGGVNIGSTSTGGITLGAATTLSSGISLTLTGTEGSTMLTMTAGDAVISDGSLAITDDDNASSLSVINNTATTAAVFSAVSTTATFTGTTTGSYAHISHSGLTTGTLLRLTAAAADTSVGVVDLAMAALTSGSALRVTAGGANLTSGGKVVEVAMGAATDGAGLTITTSGTYIGAGVLQIVANSATSPTGLLNISATGLTSGSAVLMTTSTANFTTGGKFIEMDMVAATAGNGLTVTTTGAYTGTGMVLLTAGAMTTGILTSLISTTGLTSGSLLRATTSTAGALATNGAISIRGTGAHTSTSNTGILDVRSSGMVGTLANATLVNFMATAAAQVDTTILNIEASGFTTGYTGTMVRITSPTTTGSGTLVGIIADGITSGGTAMDISVDALTTGLGLNIANSGGAMTTGSLIRVAAQGTGAIATNGIISFTHTGAFTSTSATDGGFVEIKANDTTAGVVLNLVADALTTGVGVHVSNGSSAVTSGSLLRVTTGGTGAIATNGVVSFTHTGNFTSTSATDGGFVEVKANDTTAGTAFNLVADALTTGLGMHLSNGTSAMTTGSLLRVTASGTGAIATNGLVSFTHNGIFTSTSATDGGFVEIKAANTIAGTLVNVVGAGLTTGIGMHISNGTAATTSGSLLRVTAGGTGAVATNGIVSIAHTGVYTSTSRVGLLNVNASATTGGTVAHIMGAAVTDGTILSLEAVEATLTTGLYIQCYDGAANDFSVGRYGATTIAGNASGTAALTITAGDFLMSAGVLRMAVSATITADVGSVQGGSALTRGINEISVCANAGDAVTLPTAVAGQVVYIVNHGAQSADVFPASGDAINEAAANTAKALAADAAMVCFSYDETNWECNTLAR